MVSAIDTNIINKTQQTALNQTGKSASVKKLAKYVNNEALTQAPDTFTSTAKRGASSALLFERLPFAFLLKRNKKLNGKFINNEMKALGETNKQALQNLFGGKDKLSKRIADFIRTSNQSNRDYVDLRSNVKAQYKLDKLKEKLAKNPASEKLKSAVSKATEKAEATASKTGAKAVEAGIKNGSKLGKFGKFIKSSGAGIMLVFSGITEVLTEVVPTFKELGAEKGLKQLGKSAIKVAGDTAGFIAGQQVGVAAGTAIGTAIFPGVGTAIGAAVGFVGGLLGSFVAGKITKAITGPSEREIAKEEQYNQAAEEIANDNNQLQELKDAASLKIQQEAELNGGQLSEDALIALETLENLEDSSTNPFAA